MLAVLLTLSFLYLLGLFSANVFGGRFIRFLERQLERVPMVKTIYRSTKQIVSSIGGIDSKRFHRVVLVEVPRPGMKRIAFLTSVMSDSDSGRPLANVFIPYTPYLTTGYMQIVPLEEVSETNWTFEEAAKLVMSGGIISPPEIPFDRHHPVELAPAPGGMRCVFKIWRTGPGKSRPRSRRACRQGFRCQRERSIRGEPAFHSEIEILEII